MTDDQLLHPHYCLTFLIVWSFPIHIFLLLIKSLWIQVALPKRKRYLNSEIILKQYIIKRKYRTDKMQKLSKMWRKICWNKNRKYRPHNNITKTNKKLLICFHDGWLWYATCTGKILSKKKKKKVKKKEKKKKTVEYDIKLYLIPWLQFWRSWEYWEHLYCHYSQVFSDMEWLYSQWMDGKRRTIYFRDSNKGLSLGFPECYRVRDLKKAGEYSGWNFVSIATEISIAFCNL